MRKTLLTLAAALALAGCATPPAPVASNAPAFHFWNRLGPAAQSVSQVFDDGTTTYVLPKPGVAILGVQVQMRSGQFIPASLALDGPYYTFPGVYPAMHVDLIGRVVAIANPHPAEPAAAAPNPATKAHAPVVAQSTPRNRANAAPKADKNAVTIESLYRGAPQKMDAKVEGGILTLRLDALISLLPGDWAVYPGQGVDAHRMVAVYLDQTPQDAMRSVCQELSMTCAINEKTKTMSMFKPAPVEGGQHQPEGVRQ